jgi:hypothetical protein
VGLGLLATPARAEVSGDTLRVSLVTFGPGEHPFFRFGHNAILVEQMNGPGIVYNFGMFDFSSPALIPKFVLGRSHYWLGRTDRDRTFESYIEDNRTVEVDELELTAAQRKALFERLEDNSRPQNREYLYDYFNDNCSTRVRDALDAVLDGKLRAAASGPTRLTYRGHALRLVEDLTWEYVALYYLLGLPADKRGTKWDEGFIPMELRDVVRAAKVDDKPLSASHRVIFKSTNPEPPSNPPARLTAFVVLGLALGGLFALLGTLATRPRRSGRAARVVFAGLSGVIGLVAGLGGCLLVFLWVATNHRACHANVNVLQSVPWALAFVATAWGLGRGDPQAERRAFRIAVAAVATSAFGLVARVSGLLPQENTPFIALFLPLWLGLAYGCLALGRGAGRRMW